VLEVGSGAGRFTRELLTSTEADVYSVDYSSAVEANFRNNGHHDRLYLYQASIYELPFKPQQFDYVLCLGVLQHTPDFRKSIQALAAMVKPGGKLVVDFYCIRGWWTKVSAKYALRPLTKRLPQKQLLRLIQENVDWMMSFSRFNKQLGLGVLNRFIPVCDFQGTLPPELSADELREWVVLDTFDVYSPAHDHPQRLETVAEWVQEAGLIDVEALQVECGVGKAATVRASRAPAP
jgi:SAM-dependent methyltransferase